MGTGKGSIVPTESRRPSGDGTEGPLERVVSGPPYTIFSPASRLFIVITVSLSALISPFGATTFYPALDVLADELHVTPSLINLSLTTYMIAQAIAPSLIAGASDNTGRRLSFIVCFIIFICANVGLALQTNYAALLVLRMVQASGCSAAIALGTAVVADVATSAERGRYMGYATAGLLFGPAFGPTLGGLLIEYLNWRASFWFLCIFTGVLLVVFTLFFPETCRNVVGNGSIPAKGIDKSIIGEWQRRQYRRRMALEDEKSSIHTTRPKKTASFPNPLHTLKIVAEKESGLILFYNGFFFTGMMMTTGAIPTLYSEQYGLSVLETGLCYISMGVGSLVSTLTMGHVTDWNFRRHAARLGFAIKRGRQQDLSNFPIEKVRFQVVLPGHIIGTLAYIAFGWTVHYRTSLPGPEIALFFIGFGVSTAFNLTNTLLIDLHKDKPATATAAVNFVRCLLSAGGAAAIIPMCNAMGIGWAFTSMALVYVVWIAMLPLLMAKGMKWRQEAAAKRKVKEAGVAKSEHDEEAQTRGREQREAEDKDEEAKADNSI
ncbi:MFS general substrate transporter [Teratosphaeria nubilosa]|uniref:MFS general substrate transporter n=1 Tax=Teratosphaeria nubilosa TaxID=161662 RepID=A0A6G1KZ83_9PEZI|nr:MFS general substrate transporter [Teratosphaeria nubilosa]